MAQKINVNRNVQDPFYRYKMPRILAKVEGKGNGIKTVIVNMPEIAKALSRPPTYPTKYFGCELGAQTNFDLKNDRYIVNGDHDASKLQDLLDSFIRKFVLCTACENPETVLNVKKSSIQAKCKACGHIYQIDPKQKLSTYIMKNPPAQENGDTPDAPAKTNDGGSPPAEEAIVEENASAIDNNHSGGSLDEPDDDDWAPEPDGETEKLSGEMSKMVVDKDLEKSDEERLDLLYQYFQKAVKDGTIQDGKKMLNEAERLELKNKAPLLLADVLFTTEILAQIKTFQRLLLRFCINDKKAQRHLLGGIEIKVKTHKDILLAKSAHIIKALYDNDLCEEEVLLEWGAKPNSRYVSKKFFEEIIKVAQPVLKWLKEAEEGSETDNEGQDGDMAVAFDDRSRAIGTTVVEEKAKKEENNKGQSNGKQAATNNNGGTEDMKKKNAPGAAKIDEDDVDIDNI